MRREKFKSQLYLLQLLTGNCSLSAQQISDLTGFSIRNIYYYLSELKECGFLVQESGGILKVLRRSPFLKKMAERISFTDDEAAFIGSLVKEKKTESPLKESIEDKLSRFHNLRFQPKEKFGDKAQRCLDLMKEAISLRRQAIIVDYNSPNSNTISSRRVEPYMMVADQQAVLAWELTTKTNKTFKIKRMGDVLVSPVEWQEEDSHCRLFTDIFMFTAPYTETVTLSLGKLAYNVLKEEYPESLAHITREEGENPVLRLPVCSYKGIGRFVLGLFQDIEVLGNDGFKDYLRTRATEMTERLGKKEERVEISFD